jgi:hypothetical protein
MLTKINEITAKTVLTKTNLPGCDYVVNPYNGCQFACMYCYAAQIARWKHPGEKWGSFMDIKLNAPDLLKKELEKLEKKYYSKNFGIIWFSSVTDPYTGLEAKYQLTRKCLEVLVDFGYEGQVAIQTKSGLIVRDIDLYKRFKDVSIGFTVTTLDTLGRSLAVKCFKVNPDSSEVQVGPDIAIKPGGNSGNCSLENNRLTESNKTYYFYAVAYANGESYRSDSVAVDYNTSGPGTPANYKKEREGTCRYKISFEASNDGKTNRIDIYRSDLTEFIADSGSKIGEVGISPGQEGSFTDVNVPDCQKTYYYVIRAFDSAGNTSGLVGDFITVYTTTQTSSDTTGSVVPAIPIIGDDNIPLEEEAGEVDQETDQVDQDTGEPEEGSVLGSEDKDYPAILNQFLSFVKLHPFYFALGVILLLVIIRYALKKVSKKKR